MPASTERTAIIAATPEKVMSVVTDFESYPSWQKEVQDALVHARDEQDRPIKVTITTVAMGMTVNALLDVTYGENTMDYTLAQVTDMTIQQDAHYVLTPQPDGTTELTLTMAVDLKWNVPEFMLKQLISKGVNDNIKAVKRVAEAG